MANNLGAGYLLLGPKEMCEVQQESSYPIGPYKKALNNSGCRNMCQLITLLQTHAHSHTTHCPINNSTTAEVVH